MVDDLHTLDLNLLVVFATLMCERNVTRCAKRLRVGQPTISASLARLRVLFQDPLFVRTGRGVQPTENAQHLFELIKPALNLIEAAVKRFETFDPVTSKDQFIISVKEDVSVSLISSIVRPIIKLAPQAQISFVRCVDAANSRYQAPVSLAIGCFAKTKNGYIREVIAGCSSVLVRSANTLEIRDSTELVSRPHLEVPFGDGASERIDVSLRRLGLTRRCAVRLSCVEGTVQLIAGTDTVAIIPDLEALVLTPAKGIVMQELPGGLDEKSDLSMVWPVSKNLHPADVWFRDQIRSNSALLATGVRAGWLS
jgi:LysR family transcriptional activator of mexEF-oprN operon